MKKKKINIWNNSIINFFHLKDIHMIIKKFSNKKYYIKEKKIEIIWYRNG